MTKTKLSLFFLSLVLFFTFSQNIWGDTTAIKQDCGELKVVKKNFLGIFNLADSGFGESGIKITKLEVKK